MTKYYTTSDVAKICNVHRNTIIGAIRKGLLSIHRTPGGHARISQEDLDDFCHRRSLPTTSLISRNNRALILDPDPKFAATLAKAMRDFEYQVEAARDPFQAGYLVGKFQPNVVLVELEIGPDMTGASVCRSVRSLPKLRDTAVIGMSADKQQEKIDALLDAGADDFVAKPFEVEHMVERIVNLIGPVIIGTSGRATTGEITGKLTKRVAPKTTEVEPDADRSTRKATPRQSHRTTHGGVLAGPEEEEDFGT
ncbi:MAG: response regulator [Planctomycetota bacterium]|nr:response regulator [Planctomycetota bacterium]